MGEYAEGDVNHNVQPVIGWLRLALDSAQREGTPVAMSQETVTGLVAKLQAACEAERTWLAGRAEWTAQDRAEAEARGAAAVVERVGRLADALTIAAQIERAGDEEHTARLLEALQTDLRGVCDEWAE